jgi:cell division topological specificity factor
MRLLELFLRPVSAPIAKERLQVLLAHERGPGKRRSELLELLRSEILRVIAKRLDLHDDQVSVSLRQDSGTSTLALAIELPSHAAPAAVFG